MTRLSKLLLIFGVIFTVVPPLVGFLMTVLSMIAAFHDLSAQGIADPHTLAAHIGWSLTATLVGVIFSALGIVMLIVAGLQMAFAQPTTKLS